jgi:hypothetical protein
VFPFRRELHASKLDPHPRDENANEDQSENFSNGPPSAELERGKLHAVPIADFWVFRTARKPVEAASSQPRAPSTSRPVGVRHSISRR